MGFSVNTNSQAVLALQSLGKTDRELSAVQKRVSTGFRVADAKDDGGAFAAALAVRSDTAGLQAVNEQLGGIKGIVETTFASLGKVSDTMKELRQVVTRLADSSTNTEQRTQYNAQFTALTTQIGTFLDDAKYNGRSLLSTTAPSGGDIDVLRNEDAETFQLVATDGAAIKTALTVSGGFATASAAATFLTTTFNTQEGAVATALNRYGTDLKYVENQITFNADKIDSLNNGLGALVDADLAKESAKLQALQVRQQLGIQTLGLANQGPQVLLSLFR